ncbi:hypothetical protein SBC1_37030 (plasmid) [Caballeronia sp. SBC1]|nr:hypothetical protein SBC2_50910 [Caballeronia sp. SBC2]QIN63663.1 hypothetical protein SBC1_37030 [Caballeronia sp. SBC1]
MLQAFTRMNRTTMNVLKPEIANALRRLHDPIEFDLVSPRKTSSNQL